MRTAVIPCVRARDAVVGELVANRLPGLAAVVGARHHLAEPAAALRDVDAVRIRRGTLHVIDLPAREMRPRYVPALSLPVGGESERPLPCADKHSYSAHCTFSP